MRLSFVALGVAFLISSAERSTMSVQVTSVDARHHRRESNSLQADLLNVPVVRPRVSETTALGAAYLAGLAVGYWKSQADIARQWQANKRFTPAMKAPERKRMASGWERALGRAKAWEEA